MPEFKDLPDDFYCPHHHGCPYLEGLSTRWVWQERQEAAFLQGEYEHQLEQLNDLLEQQQRQCKRLELENQQLRAQLHALHRRQFKGRTSAAAPTPECSSAQRKRRGAPLGHPPWQRAKPSRIDQVIGMPAPQVCPDCQHPELRPVHQLHEHVQEDIVLAPRTVVTCFQHQLAYCPRCEKNVHLLGPAEMPGAYIGPAAKATATYLRYQLNVSERKISQFFSDFFGLSFVPASAYGFERQAVRRGLPLYEDLRQKIRALPTLHADETGWRHDGHHYWMWYAGDDDLAFFHLDEHRSTEAAQSVLGERFGGTIVADAFASYRGVHPKDWQSCLAHIKRKAKELGQELALLKGPAADPKALEFCQNVEVFVRDACQAHRRLSQRRWRAKIARRKARQLRRRLRRLCRTPLRYPKAETLRKAPPGSRASTPLHLLPSPQRSANQQSGRAESASGGHHAQGGSRHSLGQRFGKPQRLTQLVRNRTPPR